MLRYERYHAHCSFEEAYWTTETGDEGHPSSGDESDAIADADAWRWRLSRVLDACTPAQRRYLALLAQGGGVMRTGMALGYSRCYGGRALSGVRERLARRGISLAADEVS